MTKTLNTLYVALCHSGLKEFFHGWDDYGFNFLLKYLDYLQSSLDYIHICIYICVVLTIMLVSCCMYTHREANPSLVYRSVYPSCTLASLSMYACASVSAWVLCPNIVVKSINISLSNFDLNNPTQFPPIGTISFYDQCSVQHHVPCIPVGSTTSV